MILNRILAVCLLLAFTSTATPQAAKRPITLEDLWKVKRLGKPSIAPDGAWVAVDVTTHNMDDNSSNTQIWLCSTDGKTQKQLTTNKASSSNPIWSPDGKTIAFTSKRGDSTQIYVIAPDGGEARQLSKLPMTPSGLKWGADSKTIYCVVWTWPDTPDDAGFRKKEQARKDDKVQAYVIDDALYRVWDHWIADGKRPVVFAVDAEKGSHRNLFAHTKRTLPASGGSASDYDISPDGKEICFTSESAKELGMDFNSDLYVMSIENSTSPGRKPGDAEPKNITSDNPAADFAPVYSPTGTMIAFSRQTTRFFYADRSRLMVYDRKINKIVNEVTAKLDRSCHNPHWLANDPKFMFEIEDRGCQKLAASNDAIILEFGNQDHSQHSLAYLRLRFDEDLKIFRGVTAFLQTTFGYPNRLCMMKDRDRDYYFDPNRKLVEEWDLGEVKNVTYKGADDEDVQMWIVYPPNFDAKKKWPLLMFIHGGPHNAITTDFHYRWNPHLFAAKGYVVAIPNFHGSSGFGQKFTDSITGDMATRPFIDVMKATDYMEAKPYIDKKRTTAAGASYGGYMMAWLNGHTDRYKAMICHAGVYNWDSMMASDFVRGRERPLGAFPWGDQAKVDKHNPQRFAKNFKTPTLVMHGEKDYRVPITQGMEYYNTLRIKGVPTRFVYFPDENHWILKPQNARLWHREFFAWLEKHVGSGPTK